jgi:hypothetical protein
MLQVAPRWWWMARPFGHDLTETTTMIVIAFIVSLAAVGALCWLTFALSVNALPVMAGRCVAIWAHRTCAGIAASVAIGLSAAGAAVAIGWFLLIDLRRPGLNLRSRLPSSHGLP